MNLENFVFSLIVPIVVSLVTTIILWKVIEYQKAREYGNSILLNCLIAYIYTIWNLYEKTGKDVYEIKTGKDIRNVYIESMKHIINSFENLNGNIYWLKLLQANPEINKFIIHLIRDYSRATVNEIVAPGSDTIKYLQDIYNIVKKNNKIEFTQNKFLIELDTHIIKVLFNSVKD